MAGFNDADVGPCSERQWSDKFIRDLADSVAAKFEPPPSHPSLEEFTAALTKRSQSTRTLIDRVLRLPPSSSTSPLTRTLETSHQATQLLQAQLRQVQLERDQVEKDLRIAEKTVDRLRMEGASEDRKPEGFGVPPAGASAGQRSGTNTPNARNGSAGPEVCLTAFQCPMLTIALGGQKRGAVHRYAWRYD